MFKDVLKPMESFLENEEIQSLFEVINVNSIDSCYITGGVVRDIIYYKDHENVLSDVLYNGKDIDFLSNGIDFNLSGEGVEIIDISQYVTTCIFRGKIRFDILHVKEDWHANFQINGIRYDVVKKRFHDEDIEFIEDFLRGYIYVSPEIKDNKLALVDGVFYSEKYKLEMKDIEGLKNSIIERQDASKVSHYNFFHEERRMILKYNNIEVLSKKVIRFIEENNLPRFASLPFKRVLKKLKYMRERRICELNISSFYYMGFKALFRDVDFLTLCWNKNDLDHSQFFYMSPRQRGNSYLFDLEIGYHNGSDWEVVKECINIDIDEVFLRISEGVLTVSIDEDIVYTRKIYRLDNHETIYALNYNSKNKNNDLGF